jgi:hypothetical protein
MKFRRAKIIKCKPHENYRLWIQFDDGIEGEVELKHLAGKGVFSAWNSIEYFKSVYIDKRTDTITWGEEIDLDPYVLYNNLIQQKKSL